MFNDLIYIPKTKDEIQWATPEGGNRFWAFLEQDDYLKNHKGEYAGAYAINFFLERTYHRDIYSMQ
jgi:hypothetical protein